MGFIYDSIWSLQDFVCLASTMSVAMKNNLPTIIIYEYLKTKRLFTIRWQVGLTCFLSFNSFIPFIHELPAVSIQETGTEILFL